MATSIAEYYTSELDDWKDSLYLHLERISESEERLSEILHYNTIPNLAANVEHNINQLFLLRQNLSELDRKISFLQQKLYHKDAPVRDELVTEEIKKQHKEIRDNIYKVEKEYLDIKYACDVFIASTIIEQNKKTDKDRH